MIKYNKYIYKKNEIKDPKLRLLINHHAGFRSSKSRDRFFRRFC